MRTACRVGLALAATVLIVLRALANDPPAAPVPDEGASVPDVDERVRVAARPDEIAGSATHLDAEHLARQAHTDIHRVLAAVPGVIVREEDGWGLRPNIGMRGAGAERSSKITLLEDGVPIAPAPYSAPAAYYFPSVARMEGIEIRKGSSSIQHGPSTTGGVLNLLSASIPARFGGSFDAALGGHDTHVGRVRAGEGAGRLGWLVETYQHETAGFKHLDGGGETGFDLADWVGKLRLTSAPAAAMFQSLELKAGTTTQTGHETYVGLTDEDFAVDPFRRYAGSQEDRIDSDHEQLHARYYVRPRAGLDVTATLYRNDFFRNWRKLEAIEGVAVASVLADPPGHPDQLAILRGDLAEDSAAGALTVRNNRRDYYAQGIHAVVGLELAAGATRHELELGARWHEDEEDRFQENDGFRMTAAGRMVRTSEGVPGSQANRVGRAEALALFVQDEIRAGRLTLVPGVRFESIDFERVDYGDPDRTTVAARLPSSVNVWIPGMGTSWRLTGGGSVFAGVHRGFAPPTPGDTDANAERSVNWELGWRNGSPSRPLQLVGFYSDYANLLGSCTVSSGCSSADVGDVFDGGAVDVSGVEASIAGELAGRGGARFPVSAAYTFTRARFQSSFESEFESWGSVERGDELPYVPEHQASVSGGVLQGAWSATCDLTWVDAMRTVAGQGPLPESESTDAHLLADLSVAYDVGRDLRLYARVRNLTDEVYVAARRPAGLRPGLGRTALFGVTLRF